MDETIRAHQIALAVRGNQEALQQLIVGYHDALRVAVDGRLASPIRRHLDPEDVLQATYAEAFQSVTGCRFPDPAAFYRWLETIAFDRLKDMVRALRRQKRDIGKEVHGSFAASASSPDFLHRLVAPDSTPSRQLARNETVAAVLSSLARLTHDQRDVVRLRYLERMTVADVAARLGKTKASVHMLCHRGLKALRGFMASISHYLSHH